MTDDERKDAKAPCDDVCAGDACSDVFVDAAHQVSTTPWPRIAEFWTPCRHYKSDVGFCPDCYCEALGLPLWKRPHKYILDENGRAVPEFDLLKWARWFENNDNRRVALAKTPFGDVSTVFLGLDHAFGSGPPLLYETMVFGGLADGDMDRYSTREQAVKGHKRMLRTVYLSWLWGPFSWARALGRRLWRRLMK